MSQSLNRVLFLKVTLLSLLVLLALGTSGIAMGQATPQGLDPFTATSNFDALRGEAVRAGSLQVIVGVAADFSGASNDLARQQVALSAQHSVLSSLAGHNARILKQFKYIPFMALVVDAAALDTLRANPLVTSITNDALSKPTMESSAAVIGVRGAGGAWEMGYEGTGQVVAVLDTGVDKAHPALSGQVVAEACFNTNNAGQAASSRCPGGVETSTAVGSGVDCDESVAVGCEHGTHVAGTVASTDATNTGVAPEAKLVAINVFSLFSAAQPACGGDPCVLSFITDQIEALEHVYDLRTTHDLVSLNMSLGGGQFTSEATCDANNAATKAAIDLLRGVNIASVIASGNDGFTTSMGAPGCISSAVSVAATTDADAVASFSNVASFLEFYAPGVSITSADQGETGFQTFQGTSMATPHVAGTWALLRQASPSSSVSALVTVLTDTGVLVDDVTIQDKPRIQVNAALTELIGDPNVLVSNGDFDDNDDATPKLPDGWVKSGLLTGDKVRTDGATIFSHSAPNAFQFKAALGEGTSILFQNINPVAKNIAVGDELVLTAFVDQKTAPNNLVIGKVVIKYSDSTPKTQIKLRMPASKTPGYVQIASDPFVLTSAAINKMNVQFYYLPTSGKFMLDTVVLERTPAALGAIGLPAAPKADLRGN
jgi:subtilisin family serine protease